VARNSHYLLIDISNSFTKLAFASQTRVFQPSRIATAKLSGAYLGRFARRRKIGLLVVSSVVPRKNPVIRSVAGKTKVLWLNPQSNLGVGIDYPWPRSIGADRLANAAAVAELYGCPSIVVDFGTAVTFDIVSKCRNYIGGVIAPGLEAMTNFLYQRTALLPKLSLEEPRQAIGKSTLEAMRSGAVFGYRGLVREIIARIKAEQFRHQRVHVVATGGYARLIASKLREIDAIHPHLTLEGLRIIANLNS
jgi:type III pantothenate kinase